MSVAGDLTRINVMQPWLGEEEAAAVADVIRSGWVAQSINSHAASCFSLEMSLKI